MMTASGAHALVGIPGRFACLAAVVLAAVGGSGRRAAWALALALVLALACHRPAFRALRAGYAWIMLALLLVLVLATVKSSQASSTFLTALIRCSAKIRFPNFRLFTRNFLNA